MKFLPSWSPTLSLAVLTLHATRILAINSRSDLGNYFGKLWNETKHDFDKVKSSFEDEVSKEVAKSMKSRKGVVADFTMGHNIAPPISNNLKTSTLQSEVTVGLYDVDGGYPQPAAFDFARTHYSGWNNSWLGFALDSFDAVFEVDVDLTAVANGELTLSLLEFTEGADGVEVEVEFQLYMTADADASMSFTTGLNLSLSEPAAIMMPALDPLVKLNQSERIGFNPGHFTLTPIFNATMPKLDFSLQFSLRTVLSVVVEGINIGALTLDLPAFHLSVDTRTNKMANCQTPPAGTPPDQIYAELIHLQGALDAKLTYELFDDHTSGTIDHWTIWNVLDECYAFLPGLGSIGAVPPSSKSAVLTAPAITKCTSDGRTTEIGAALKSLSPGAKAGAVIGTLVGVSLVAAIAWCGGRASQRHSTNKRRAGSARPSKRLRFGNFFGRGNRGGANDLDFVSSMPVRQTDVSEPSTEMQTQYPHQSWQRVKGEQFVMTTETTTPSTGDLSLGEGWGSSTPGLGETNNTWNSPESTQYEGFRSEPAEGLGLLQGEGRPRVQWRSLPRKTVPGQSRGSESL